MTTVRRLKAVSAVFGVAALLTSAHVWGEPTTKDRAKERVLAGRTEPAPASDLTANLAVTKFSTNTVLRYKTVQGETLFALQIQPKLDPVPPRPRDFLVLVDPSASQAGSPLAHARVITEALSKDLKPGDRLAIGTVNVPKATRLLTKSFHAAGDLELANGLKEFDKEVPLGATDLKDGVHKAIDIFKAQGKAGQQKIVLFMGDGMSEANRITEDDRYKLCQELVKADIGFFPIPLGRRLLFRTSAGRR